MQPIPEEQSTNRVAALNKNKDLSGHLFCPHDLSINVEFRDDLPTLLGMKNNQADSNEMDVTSQNIKLKEKCAISIYDTPENSEVIEQKFFLFYKHFNLYKKKNCL